MKNWEKNIQEIFDNDLVICDQTLSTEMISYQQVYQGEVGVIAINIREYQDLCDNYPSQDIAKVIQAYSRGIITIGQEHKNYLFSFLNGGEIILVYKLTCQSCLKTMKKIAQTINTDFRTFFTDLLKKQFNIKIAFGIGVSVQKKQIISQYKQKTKSQATELTVIGRVVNKAHLNSQDHNSIKIDY